MHRITPLFRVTLLVLLPISAFGQDASQFTPGHLAFFEKSIRPVLVKHCYECHSKKTHSEGELLLDSRSGMFQGGASGPAVVPGKPERSLLIAAVRYKDRELSMPPQKSGGRLPDAVIADLEKWVAMGAPAPGDDQRSEIAAAVTDVKKWWAFQPVKSPRVPETNDTRWPLTEIDRFILAAYDKRDLKPVETADRSTLIRRVYLDLIGLPPTPEDQEQFLASSDPQA